MHLRKWITFILFSCLISVTATAGELSQCLYSATYQEHRLEKENSVRACFNKYKSFITKDTCYLFLEKKVSKLSSTRLNEDINSICFYETTLPKDLNSCLLETKRFKSSSNHDEAVFFCYQQYQDRISQKDCLKTASQMIYPAKKEYLQQHCYNHNI